VNLSRNATTSGYASAAIGSESSTVDGNESVAIACDGCMVSGNVSVASGSNAHSTLPFEHVHSSATTLGEHQYRRLIAWANYTGNGDALLYVNGSAALLQIPNNTIWGGHCDCVAMVKTAGSGTSVGDHKYYNARFTAKNIASTVSVQYIDDTDAALDSPSFASSSLSLTADNTNDALTPQILSIPGSAGSVTHINCVFHITETAY